MTMEEEDTLEAYIYTEKDIEVNDLYTHKDGDVYKVLSIEVVDKTIQLKTNKKFKGEWFKNNFSRWIKFTETLIWYTPTHDDMEIFVRTKSHFLSSFTKGTPIKHTPKEQ